MTNFEKYKTAQEAILNFKKFCHSHEWCKHCKFNFVEIKNFGCIASWLYDEAPPTPLPKSWCERVMNKFTRKD